MGKPKLYREKEKEKCSALRSLKKSAPKDFVVHFIKKMYLQMFMLCLLKKFKILNRVVWFTFKSDVVHLHLI